VKVSVYIDDLNDNAPRFTDPLVTLALSESASVASAYVIPAALDDDSPQFGVQRYELDSLSDKFGLEVTQNIDGTQEVQYSAVAGSSASCWQRPSLLVQLRGESRRAETRGPKG